MAMDTSLSAIPAREFDERKARHLLERAGFGGPPEQVAALARMGLAAAVDLLVDGEGADAADLLAPAADPDIIKPLEPAERAEAIRARRDNDTAALERLRVRRLQAMAEDRAQMDRLASWWLARMIATPSPLREKMTLLWHSHFAANHRTVGDSYLMLQQNELFRRHATGNFGALAMEIVRDPAMLRFLDNHTNRKGKPNENLARELMELFTLGEGHYTEGDIKDAARALTGYSFEDNDFEYLGRSHDDGAKTILGQQGRWNGEDLVRILLRQPACPRFVAWKLYRHFVADVEEMPSVGGPARTVIESLAQALTRSGYELRPVLKTLFMSRHFYDSAVMGGMIKSPAQLVVGAARVLGSPVRDVGLLHDGMRMMGQRLFEPPSVAGWETGRAWINTSTLFVRQNLCTYLITGRLPYGSGRNADRQVYDPSPLLAGVDGRDAGAVVDRLARALLAVEVAPERRSVLLDFARERGGVMDRDTLTGLLLLITAMPEYQLC